MGEEGEIGVEEKRRTLEDVAGKVALVLAAAGSGGRAVGVGVLPLLEEFLGLVEENLAREGESADCFPEVNCNVAAALRWCSRGRRVMVQCSKECGGRERRVVMDGWHSLSVVWAHGCWRWLQRESECTRPGRARGNGGRTSQGPA